MEVTFPDLGNIRVRGTEHNVRHFSGITRFGIEFDDLAESDHRTIIRYAHTREAEIKIEHEGRAEGHPVRVSVVADQSRAHRYAFLRVHFELKGIGSSNAVSELTDSDPHLIILDCTSWETSILLRTVRKHPALAK
jgi:hypothetical protein